MHTDHSELDDSMTPVEEGAAESTLESQETEDPAMELAQLRDKYLRLVAEFDNYKKRTSREILDLRSSARKDTIRQFLPVIDDFDRARQAADDDHSDEVFTEGVELVYQKVKKILDQLGVQKMDHSDGSFDPEYHEAITEIPAPDDSLKGKIVDVIEPGYLLGDKIIRYARVILGR